MGACVDCVSPVPGWVTNRPQPASHVFKVIKSLDEAQLDSGQRKHGGY